MRNEDRLGTILDQAHIVCNIGKGKLPRLSHDVFLVQTILAAQIVQLFKVAADRFGTCQVLGKTPRHILCDLSCQLRALRQLFQRKDMHNAFLCRPPALAIAATRRLHDAVEAVDLTVDAGKVEVDAGLHEARRNDAARLAVLEPCANLLQYLLAMHGIEIRGQVVCSFVFPQQIEDTLRRLFHIDDTKHLLMSRQLFGKLLFRHHLFAQLDLRAPEKRCIFHERRADFQWLHIIGEKLSQRRLRRRTEHRRTRIVPHERLDCGERRTQVIHRNHLRLIEDHDALGKIVQFAAFRRAIGKKRFEKLHVRRHDDGRIPVLRRQPLAVHIRILHIVIIHILMMLDDTVRPQQIPKDSRILLDDRRIRYDIDDAPALSLGMSCIMQSKRQGRNRLAPSRRYG